MEKLFIDQRKKWDWCRRKIEMLRSDIEAYQIKLNESIKIKKLSNTIFDICMDESLQSELVGIGLEFGCIVNALRSILDNSIMNIVVNNCTTNKDAIRNLTFPVYKKEQDWENWCKRNSKCCIPDNILKLLAHVQPFNGFGRNADRPDENIITLLINSDNKIKHYSHAEIDWENTIKGIKFEFKKVNLEDVFDSSDINISILDISDGGVIAKIKLNKEIEELNIISIEHADLNVKVEGEKISIINSLGNMLISVRAVVEILEFGLIEKESFLGLPFVEKSNRL